MLTRLTRALTFRHASHTFERLAREHPLRYLFLEITRRCNLSCVYCGSDCSPATRQREQPAAFFADLLTRVAADFDATLVMVAVTGGEPLLKPGVEAIFATLHAHRFPWGMVTNGALLDRARAELMVATGLRSISLSLDGPAAANDPLRGEGVAAGVERAIGHLRAAGFKGKLGVISTLTRPVLPHLEATRRLLAAWRVPMWRLVPVFPLGRAQARAELVLDASDTRAVLDFIKAARADGKLPRPEFGDEGYLGYAYEKVVRDFHFQCNAGLSVAGVMFDGRVGACPELGEAFLQGDATRESFTAIWRERYQIFRDRSWTRQGECAACDRYAACRGGSLHLYAAPHTRPCRCTYLQLERA